MIPQTPTLPSAPPQVHLELPGQGSRESSAILKGPQLLYSDGSSNTTPVFPVTPRFFELCVNTGEFCQTLGEMDVTRVSDDICFFEKVRAEYWKIRGCRIKRFLARIFLKPAAMQYVRFCVQDRHRAYNTEKNSLPPKKQVASQEYDYRPCPLKPPHPMPSNAFMHQMKCAGTIKGVTRKAYWLHAQPKKLAAPVTQAGADVAEGWGVHILEGPNYVYILFSVICALLACILPLVAYVVKTGDVSGFAGVGSLLVAALTLLFAPMKVQQFADD